MKSAILAGLLVGFLALSPVVGHADQLTPSELALQVDGAVNVMAQQLEAAQKQIADLQDKLRAAEAQRQSPGDKPAPGKR